MQDRYVGAIISRFDPTTKEFDSHDLVPSFMEEAAKLEISRDEKSLSVLAEQIAHEATKLSELHSQWAERLNDRNAPNHILFSHHNKSRNVNDNMAMLHMQYTELKFKKAQKEIEVTTMDKEVKKRLARFKAETSKRMKAEDDMVAEFIATEKKV